jgi:hypothetical protein
MTYFMEITEIQSPVGGGQPIVFEKPKRKTKKRKLEITVTSDSDEDDE